MISRSPHALGWLTPPLLFVWNPPGFYVVAMAILGVLFGLVAFGHAILGLVRDWQRFRNGD